MIYYNKNNVYIKLCVSCTLVLKKTGSLYTLQECAQLKIRILTDQRLYWIYAQYIRWVTVL